MHVTIIANVNYVKNHSLTNAQNKSFPFALLCHTEIVFLTFGYSDQCNFYNFC